MLRRSHCLHAPPIEYGNSIKFSIILISDWNSSARSWQVKKRRCRGTMWWWVCRFCAQHITMLQWCGTGFLPARPSYTLRCRTTVEACTYISMSWMSPIASGANRILHKHIRHADEWWLILVLAIYGLLSATALSRNGSAGRLPSGWQAVMVERKSLAWHWIRLTAERNLN